MGQSENNTNHRENNSAPQFEASLSSEIEAQKAVQKLTGALELLHSNVLNSLQEDVKRLVEEKRQLVDDVRLLQVQKNNLQSTAIEQQQQVLIRQLVQVLANHVSIQLRSDLEQLFESAIVRVSKNNTRRPYTETAITTNSEVYNLITSLKAAVTSTFEELQSELSNYQSNFSMQLSRMYSEQEQGEAILAELVYRLRNELSSAPQNLGTIEEFPAVELEEALENPETAEFYTFNNTANTAINESESQSDQPHGHDPHNEAYNTAPGHYQLNDTVIPNPVTRAQIEAYVEPVENAEFVQSNKKESDESFEYVKSLKPQELPPQTPKTPELETIVPTPIPTPSIRRRRVEATLPPRPPETEVGRASLPTSLRVGLLLLLYITFLLKRCSYRSR